MSFIEYRFTLTSLGELRARMLNVNMNKWAEKRADINRTPYINRNVEQGPLSQGPAEVLEAVCVSHDAKFKFGFQCHMLHAACPAALQHNRRNRAIVEPWPRYGEAGRGGAAGFFGPLQARNSTRANDNADRARFWHWISARSTQQAGANESPSRGCLSLSVCVPPPPGFPCAAVVCVDDWFHGKVDFNQQMFMQFFFSSLACPFFACLSFRFFLLRVLAAWGFAGWQELWHYPYLERSIAALGGRSCSCLSLNCPERIIKSSEHWTYSRRGRTQTQFQSQPHRAELNRKIPNRLFGSIPIVLRDNKRRERAKKRKT